jgi:hypothetical protein
VRPRGPTCRGWCGRGCATTWSRRSRHLRFGDVTHLANFGGAVIDARAFARHRDAIDRAHADPTISVLAGGRYDDGVGWFGRPTVLQGGDPGHDVFRTEFFGPILAVHVYDDAAYDTTVEQLESASEYGLTGAVIAGDRRAIAEGTETLRFAAGNFYVSDNPPAPSSVSSPSAAGAPRARTTRPARRRTCCAGPAPARSRRPSSPRRITSIRTWADLAGSLLPHHGGTSTRLNALRAGTCSASIRPSSRDG